MNIILFQLNNLEIRYELSNIVSNSYHVIMLKSFLQFDLVDVDFTFIHVESSLDVKLAWMNRRSYYK